MNLEQTGHLELTELTRKKGINEEQPEPEKNKERTEYCRLEAI
jgi:hypothetical protein